MSDNYHDYLVDCALIIGANELTGLMPPQNVIYSDNNYLTGKYQQQILGAISSTVAIFPFSSKSYNYPPESFQRYHEGSEIIQSTGLKRQISKNELQTIQDLVGHYNKNEVFPSISDSKSQRRSSRSRSKRQSIKNLSLDDINGSWGSVSVETIKSFPSTYFNNNLEISSNYASPQIQFLPITNNIGNRSFVIRLKFYRIFKLIENTDAETDKSLLIKIETIKDGNPDVKKTVFVPTNLLFFSKYPYFDLFRDIMSHLFKHIENADTASIEQELIEYISILTRIPILKSETLQLTFSIKGDFFSINKSAHFDKEVINWDLRLLFQTLSIDAIVTILMAMFQEQKIVFLANDTNLITLVTETILLLYRPFEWKHFYLTTTPVHLYELVDAIFPFIIGLPHELKNKIVQHYPDVIIVDLEEGEVVVPITCKLKYVSQNLIGQLKQGIQRRDWLNVFSSVSSLNPLSLKQLKQSICESNIRFSTKIITLFMTFMVNIFQEIIRNISTERNGTEGIVITLDRYLNNSRSENVPFFKDIYRTDNFNCFIDDILRKKVTNYWVQICAQRYPGLLEESKNRPSLKFTTKRNDSNQTGRDSDFQSILSNEEKKQEIVFPHLKTDGSNFYQELITNLNALDNTLDVMKLRAETLLRFGNTLRSLEEFHSVLERKPLELDYSKLRNIIRGLKPEKLIKLKSLSFYNSLSGGISFNPRKMSTEIIIERHCVEQYYPPTVPISLNNFIDDCRKADIAEYEVAINALFSCLTIDGKSTKNRTKLVAPAIFRCFYNSWTNSTMDINDVEIKMEFADEILIKGTDGCIRVDGFGQGRIILTKYRLYFIPFGYSSGETIVNFTTNNLMRLKIELKIRGFGKVTEVLELQVKGRDKKIIIWVTEEANIWFQLISELSLVHRIAEREKDISLLDLVAEQCLLYENMVICARKNGFFKANIAEMGIRMLPYSNENKHQQKQKSDDHCKYIIAKLMPSPKEMVTIYWAIEIYKPSVDNFEIWCACRSKETFFINILQILDKKLFRLLDVKIPIPMRVQTMMHIQKTNKVVICCLSNIVFVVNTQSKSEEKHFPLDINKGSYPICCMGSIYDPQQMYFGTNNGEIISWNIHTDKTEKIIKLANDDHISSIHTLNSNAMVVVSLTRLYIVGFDGEIKNIILISESVNAMSYVNCITFLNNNNKIIVGLAKLPVVLEYDLTDITNIECLRKSNIFTNKGFSFSDISSHYEPSPSHVGIVSIIAHGKCLWILLKDGTIEIRDQETLSRVARFNAHVNTISNGMLCTIKAQTIVVTVGKEDGKVNLWNLNPIGS